MACFMVCLFDPRSPLFIFFSYLCLALSPSRLRTLVSRNSSLEASWVPRSLLSERSPGIHYNVATLLLQQLLLMKDSREFLNHFSWWKSDWPSSIKIAASSVQWGQKPRFLKRCCFLFDELEFWEVSALDLILSCDWLMVTLERRHDLITILYSFSQG